MNFLSSDSGATFNYKVNSLGLDTFISNIRYEHRFFYNFFSFMIYTYKIERNIWYEYDEFSMVNNSQQ
jgi:hypothetical protein